MFRIIFLFGLDLIFDFFASFVTLEFEVKIQLLTIILLTSTLETTCFCGWQREIIEYIWWRVAIKVNAWISLLWSFVSCFLSKELLKEHRLPVLTNRGRFLGPRTHEREGYRPFKSIRATKPSMWQLSAGGKALIRRHVPHSDTLSGSQTLSTWPFAR